MVDASPPGLDDAESAFEREAASAGLTLPKRQAPDPWSAVAIAVAVIVIAVGIGQVTGWLNVRSAPASGGFKYQTCAGFPVRLSGAVTSVLDPSYATWLVGSGATLSQSVGGCVEVNVTSLGTGDVASALTDPAITFAATYVGPGDSSGVVASSSVTVIPVALTAVAIVYDLPTVTTPINLTGAVLAQIYAGAITSWNVPAIAVLNPGVDLAGLPAIQVHYDAGATATNDVLTEFLAASSPAWNASEGAGPSVSWPTGSGVASDAQMLATVGATPGAIGYIDLAGNAPPGVGIAQIEDAASTFVAPNAISTWLSAESFANSTAVAHADWTGFSLLGAGAAGSYPISMLSYIGLYRDLGVAYNGALSLTNATWVLEYIYWLTSGAWLAPLPSAFSAAAVTQLSSETYDGTLIVPPDNETGESGGETGEF
jgi:phosphate transport system substrate-binding protein